MENWWQYLHSLFGATSWSEIKYVAELSLYFLAVFAVLGCLLRLGTIRKIIGDFREARGPIWDLRNTVNQLSELEPNIRALLEKVDLLDQRVQASGKQVTELQVEAASSRTRVEENATSSPEGDHVRQQAEVLPMAEVESVNWLKLRDIWRRNTRRLEYVIDQIKDGRRKIAFDRLPRTNYERIINKLQGQSLISAAAATASRALNEEFYRYRPRNRTIPDEVISALGVLDHQLDREIVPHATVVAAEEPDAPTVRSTGTEGTRQLPAGQASASPEARSEINRVTAVDANNVNGEARV